MKIEVDHRVSILQSLPEFRRAPPPILNSQYSGLGGGFRIKVMDIWNFGNLAATAYKEGYTWYLGHTNSSLASARMCSNPAGASAENKCRLRGSFPFPNEAEEEEGKESTGGGVDESPLTKVLMWSEPSKLAGITLLGGNLGENLDRSGVKWGIQERGPLVVDDGSETGWEMNQLKASFAEAKAWIYLN